MVNTINIKLQLLLKITGGRENFQIWKDTRIRESFMEERTFKRGLERWIKLFLKQNLGGISHDGKKKCLVRVVQLVGTKLCEK